MLDMIRNWLEQTGRARSALILGAGGLAIVAILGIARFASAPRWVPLFPGLPLADAGAVTAALEEAGIAHNLAMGGAEVQVAEKDLARARVSLAQSGLPSTGSPGFELFDRPSWGMTDFTQHINYRRALEGELERTISEMRGVSAARVHIALRESSSFKRTSTPEAASVVLSARGGGRPGGELVEAIASLVASAVDGLDSDRVTVLDDMGHLLTAAIEPGSTDGYTKRQIMLQREVEGYLEQKSEALLAQTVGVGNAQVRIAAMLTFDKIDRTTQRLNPEEQVATHEERSEILPSDGQVGASSTASTTAYDVTRTVETFSGASGTVQRLSVAVLLNERTADDGTPVPWTPVDLARIESLVTSAIGLDRNRGDGITVMSAPFAVPDPVVTEPTLVPSFISSVPQYRQEIIGFIGLLLAFALGLQMLKVLKATAPRPAPGQLTGVVDADGRALGTAGGAGVAAGGSSGALARSVESPEMAARLLRSWMKES